MSINYIMSKKNITMYRLAKESGIPNTTINDLCNGRTSIENCSGITLYKIAKVLNVSIEELIEDAMFSHAERSTFDVFKSNVCHRLKDIGDMNFVIELLENDLIRKYHEMKWYAESLYLLAMLDYLCRENALPICGNYADLRRRKLAEPIFPLSVKMADAVTKNSHYTEISMREAIPEFMRFNIVECEVRNVY